MSDWTMKKQVKEKMKKRTKNEQRNMLGRYIHGSGHIYTRRIVFIKLYRALRRLLRYAELQLTIYPKIKDPVFVHPVFP